MLDTKNKSFVSVVVYIHNSENTIFEFLDKICPYISKNFQQSEFIFVNDASNDASVNLIKKYAEKNNYTITLMTMSYFQGLDLSMSAGIDLSIGDFVFEFDNTILSYDINLIDKIYEECIKGNDIVSACPKDPKHHASNLFYKIYNKNSGSLYKLRTESFRILSRRAINRVHSMGKSMIYRKAVYANCGLSTSAVYYDRKTDIPVANCDEKRTQKETAIDALILYTDRRQGIIDIFTDNDIQQYCYCCLRINNQIYWYPCQRMDDYSFIYIILYFWTELFDYNSY